eukprot:CAMPEP_0179423544 /NCGR_PEP_ID=MMETSP0799-20121207/11073_1 /TAXON_ID=46947 /ORGANISM="Geminigera cryophila, Strain CCMP2564" /LENGTH=54 /DNA_ID=CAMNT_0021197859 /DNA_START=62 /DNA_END=226 /DNA_ORIENTATION=+
MTVLAVAPGSQLLQTAERGGLRFRPMALLASMSSASTAEDALAHLQEALLAKNP